MSTPQETNMETNPNPEPKPEQVARSPKPGLVGNAASDDPFDLAKLRVSQDFLETTNVKKLLTTVPIRKPGPQDFVRVHPSPQYRDTLGAARAEGRSRDLHRQPGRGAGAANRVLHRHAVHRDQPHRRAVHVAGAGAGRRRPGQSTGTCRRQRRPSTP